MRSTTLIICLLAILIGFYFKQLWLSIIFAVALALMLGFREKPAGGAPSGGPKVQPIIVKRKYVGPESIYPEKMKIYYNPKSHDWKDKSEILGNFIGKSINWLKNLFK